MRKAKKEESEEMKLIRKRRKRICGYRLESLSVRHVLGLLLIESPLLTGYGDFADTLAACRILSTRTEKQWRRAVFGGGVLWKVRVRIVGAWLGWESIVKHWGEVCPQTLTLKAWLDGELRSLGMSRFAEGSQFPVFSDELNRELVELEERGALSCLG